MPAACLLGCGGGDGGAGPGADKLERLIKVQTAQAFLTDTGVPKPPADDPRVQEAADELDVECESSGEGEYECTTDYGGEFGAQTCSVGTDAAVTRTRWFRCRFGDEPPAVETEYTDCSDTGPVVAARDSTPGRLERVRVAMSSDVICAVWDGVEPAKAPLSAHLWASSSAAAGRVALTAELVKGEPPRIGALGRGDLSGKVGVRGRSVSLQVERDDLPDDYQAVLDAPFQFEARAFGESLVTSDPRRYP
jgi:hypothetical protein